MKFYVLCLDTYDWFCADRPDLFIFQVKSSKTLPGEVYCLLKIQYEMFM